MKPFFEPGRNIAMKVPAHEYEATVAFYRDVLELVETPAEQAVDRPARGVSNSASLREFDRPEDMDDAAAGAQADSVRFDFGGKVLWIDCVATLSQAEVWLEVVASDVVAAAAWLEARGCARRDGIEALADGFSGFWVPSPANIIHL